MVRRVLLSLLFFSLSFSLGQAAQLEKVRVGLGYLPDVQFAPFYLGAVAGLYEAQGLSVEFQHGFVTELYPLLARGKLDFVVGDAEDVISLRSQDPEGAPFVYLMALYQRVPNALFSLPEKGIESPADLRGKMIGMPGLFGSSYTSLQAVLAAAGLTEGDVTIQQIGFTQAEAVLSGRVDVAMGFVNNEPVVLSARGVEVNVLPIGPYNPSAGNGVVTTEEVLENEELVRRFLAASQEALARTLSNPEEAFEASATYIENLGADRLEVLQASLPLYTSPTTQENGLGYTDPEGWEKTLALLTNVGRVTTDLPATAFFSNDYLTPGITAP